MMTRARRPKPVRHEQCDTASIRHGDIETYKGALPADIRWTDSCQEAEQKLGESPESAGWVPGCDSWSCDAKSRASDYWQHYYIGPHKYTLIFESEQGGLSMLSMSLHESKDNSPDKP